MENYIETKSFEFAVKIVRITRELRTSGVESSLLSQLLKSGTSIGANIAEAQEAQSRNDFISKMNIALKEAYETRYWLKILEEVESFSNKQIMERIDEIIRLLVSIVKTSKSK